MGSAARGGLQLHPTPATPLKMSTLLQDPSGYKRKINSYMHSLTHSLTLTLTHSLTHTHTHTHTHTSLLQRFIPETVYVIKSDKTKQTAAYRKIWKGHAYRMSGNDPRR